MPASLGVEGAAYRAWARAFVASGAIAAAGCAAAPPCPAPLSIPDSEGSSLGAARLDDAPRRPASCSAEATSDAERTRASAEARLDAMRNDEGDTDGWYELRDALDAAIAADGDGPESARYRFLAILATSRIIDTREERRAQASLVARSRARADELRVCALDSPYAALGALALGEVLFATGRLHEAHETFVGVAADPRAAETPRARARVRAAFVGLAIAVLENRPEWWGDDDQAALFVDAITPALRAIANAIRASAEVDDVVLERARSTAAVVVLGMVMRDTVTDGRLFERIVSGLGLSESEARAAALTIVDEGDEGTWDDASDALQFLVASHVIDATVAATCDEASVALVRSLVCRTRDEPSESALAFLRACARDTPIVCEGDVRADMAVAMRAIGPMNEVIYDCLGPGTWQRPRTRGAMLRFELADDESVRLTLLEPSSDRREQRCVQRGLDAFDVHAPHGILGSAVEFTWRDAVESDWELDSSHRNARGDSPPEEGRPDQVRGVHSIAIDDDVFARSTTPVP